MPWYEQSPLSAAMGFASSYMLAQQQKKQQAFDNQLRQQALQNQQQQYAIEAAKFKQQQDAYSRSLGVDPSTGQPFQLPANLQEVAPNNHGKAPTQAQTLAHAYAYAHWLQQTGQDPSTEIDLARGIEEGIRNQNTINAENQRNQNTINAENNRTIFTQGQENQRSQARRDFDWQMHGAPTYRDLHSGAGGGANRSVEADKALAEWYSKWSAATSPTPKYVGGVLVGNDPPKVSPGEASAASHGFSLIDAAQDPQKVAHQLANATPNQTIKAFLLQRGAIAAQARAAQGGSQDGPPFPGSP